MKKNIIMRLAALAVVGAGIFALQGCFESEYRDPGYGPYAYSDAPSTYYVEPPSRTYNIYRYPSRTYVYGDYDDDHGWRDRGWWSTHNRGWAERHAQREYRHRDRDGDHDRDDRYRR
jgi:hypothetical protein